MKKRNIISIVMALVLTITAFSGFSVNVAAEEVDASNPYVYSVQNYDFDKMEGINKWLGMVTSPFWMSMGNKTGEALMFDLVDEANGNHSIEAFCIDLYTEIDGGYYKRINLEDSTYFSLDDAQRIRTIVNHGLTVMGLSDIQKSANEWLAANNMTLLVDLNGAEALSAVQAAIWCVANQVENATANESDYYVQSYTWIRASKYAGYKEFDENGSRLPNPYPVTTYTTMNSNNEIAYDQAKTENSFTNINNLIKYYLSLKASPAVEVAVSDKAIQNIAVSYVDNGDKTYDVTITCDVVGLTLENAALTLSASSMGVVESKELTENGKYTFKLEDVSAKADVRVEINGAQSVKDVFFFESEGGRHASQTLVGIDDCKVPVHAEAISGPDRQITINKSTVTDDGRFPLEGISFDIHYVCTVDEYSANPDAYVDYKFEGTDEKFETYEAAKTWAEENGKDIKEAEAVVDSDKLTEISVNAPLTTVTTDIMGKTVANITELGGKDGIYLITEHDHIAIEEPKEPFFIAVPMTTPNGDGLTYNVVIEPKNDVIDGPEIRKDVTEIGQDLDTFDVNEVHTWIIGTDIPVDLSQGKEYVIEDTLDYRLTYKGGIVVTVAGKEDKAGTEIDTDEEVGNKLELGVDYTIKTSQEEQTIGEGEAAVKESVDKFVVSLTKAGMVKVANLAKGTEEAKEIRVYFNAVIDEDAEMGILIPNKATLDYTNSLNFHYDEQSDIPNVYTCGINIYKYDANNKEEALDGAEFKLAVVVAQETEGAMPLVTNDGTVYVKYVSFYNNVALTGEKANVAVTTVDEGTAYMYGLKAGKYYLVETKAPKGYNLLSYPIEINLGIDNEGTPTVEKAVSTQEVANSNAFELPETGGIGTVVFTVGGAMLIAMAMVILVVNKKREME